MRKRKHDVREAWVDNGLAENVAFFKCMYQTRHINFVLSDFNEFVELEYSCSVSDLIDNKEITIEELCLYLVKNGWME